MLTLFLSNPTGSDWRISWPWEAMRSTWPFYGAGIVVLGLVTYIPAISLWLPSLMR